MMKALLGLALCLVLTAPLYSINGWSPFLW